MHGLNVSRPGPIFMLDVGLLTLVQRIASNLATDFFGAWRGYLTFVPFRFWLALHGVLLGVAFDAKERPGVYTAIDVLVFFTLA